MEIILAECANTELPGIKPPDPILERKWTNRKKYCHYHRNNGHNTNQCTTLKDDIEELIRKSKFAQYVKKDESRTCSRSPRKGKAVNDIEKAARKEQSDSDQDEDEPKSSSRPVAMVILRG